MIDIDKLHDQAEAAIAAHRPDEARTIYTRICDIDAADVGARMMLGAIEKENGNLEIAASHLSKATSLDPDFTEAWVMLGGIYGQLERLADAEAANRHALALDSELVDAQLNLANALKGQGKFKEAAQHYRLALQQQPGLVTAWPLLASALLEADDPAAATEAAKQAILVTPDDWQSHFVLGRALHAQDKFEEAATSLLRVTELAPDQAAAWFMAGGALGLIGKFAKAEACCRRAIKLMPDHAEAYLNLGNALREQHRLKESLKAFETALEKQPESIDALCSLGGVHAFLCKYHNAANCFQRAIERQPDNANLYRSLGNIFRLGGELAQSETACRQAVKLNPEFSGAHLELGEALSAQGRNEEALDAYDKALKLAPDTIAAISGKARSYERAREYDKAYDCLLPLIERGIKDFNLVSAYVLLSKRVNKQGDALRMTEELLDKGLLSDFERAGMHFCAGNLYDQLGEHGHAFKHIREGCKYKHAEFDREQYTEYINTIMYAFSRGNMAQLPHGENPSARPVFIVGMPRSGTSLVEQIIASHPAVYGAGELQEISRIATMLSAHSPDKAPYPRCLLTLTQSRVDSASQSYLEKIEALAGDESFARITDKMPQNFIYLGLIELLFPGARVIHTMRNPLDTCLSCYFQNFMGNLPYTYDLHNLGHFYNEYQRLMVHWRSVLDLPLLEIQYEDLVSEPESYSRQLIEFCGLEWDDACLRFYESKRLVNTASHDQVRHPVYTGSIERWRAYEQQLKPLQGVLNAT